MNYNFLISHSKFQRKILNTKKVIDKKHDLMLVPPTQISPGVKKNKLKVILTDFWSKSKILKNTNIFSILCLSVAKNRIFIPIVVLEISAE